jgi:hypothetical protein
MSFNFALRRITLPKARAIDTEGAPLVSEKVHNMRVEAVIREKRRPENHRSSGALIEDCERTDPGFDTKWVG